MKTYKLQFKIEGPFVTPMQSDTIFGQFVWMMRLSKGDASAKKFISDIVNGKGFFAVSAGFPHDKLPVPVLPEGWGNNDIIESVFREVCKEKKNIRKLEFYAARFRKILKKNSDYIGASLFADGSSIAGFKEIMTNSYSKNIEKFKTIIEKYDSEDHDNNEFLKSKSKKVFVTRNTINRLTGCTEQGALFETETEFYEHGLIKDLYVRTDMLSMEEIVEYFKIMGKYGFGADASTGKGRFSVLECVEQKFLEQEGATHMLSLGSYVPMPDEAELEESYYSLFVKRGKMGGEYAGGVNGKQMSFFKVPLIMLKEGALIRIKNKKHIYGSIERNVNIHDSEIIHSGQTFGPMVKL